MGLHSRWVARCVLAMTLAQGCTRDAANTDRAPAQKTNATNAALSPSVGAAPAQPAVPPPAPADMAAEPSAWRDMAPAAEMAQAPASREGALDDARAEKPKAERAAAGALRGRMAAPAKLGIGSGYGSAGLQGASIHESFGTGGAAMAPPLARVKEELQGFDREAYAHIAENDFNNVSDQPLSTFSIDVDTASYSNVRRFLRDGRLPPADAVRIEELVNYFDYDYPQPEQSEPFSVYAEVSDCPWAPEHRLVHIGIQGRELEKAAVPARNLVFLIDVSGSMQSPDKLPLLKRGMQMLVRDLRPQDRVSMVVYAGSSGLVLAPTSGREQATIMQALERLEAGGSTNGAEGIELAYRQAQASFVQGGINRVILATDGDFNVGVTSEGELVRLIEQKRKSGVYLTVLGFGTGNLQDSRMEQLADKGNGNYAYIDSLDEANKVLVREAGSTLVTIAKDVKLQVEMNPAHVASYRLVGYENRALAARDFNDDKKDAGEIGAGHTVTALYEIVPAGTDENAHPQVDPLRYQSGREASDRALSGELLTVKIRYKAPNADVSKLIVKPLQDHHRALADASSTFRFSAAVAGFGMLLRDSKHKGSATLSQLRTLASSAIAKDPHGEKNELIDMMNAAQRIGLSGG